MEIGTVAVSRGERATGYLEVADLPTGGTERLPVIVARGERAGPTLWITGGVHGNEMTGIAAVQDVLADGVPDGLAGTVVCVPTCNPAGLRRLERTSYYHDDDPNRFFPDSTADRVRPRRVQELIDQRLYDAIVDSADALLDFHTAQVGSMPFVIRDRVLYGTQRDEQTARTLAARLDYLARTVDLPLVTEYPTAEYEDRNLHRSTAGAVLNDAGIPALTLELGSFDVVEEENRAAGVAAAYRAMIGLGMLEAVPSRIDASRGLEAPVEFPARRYVGPHASRSGFVRHRVAAGDVVERGDPVADVVDPHGEVLETLESEHDGYVLGRRPPVVYENDPVASMAVRDEGELVTARQ